MIPPGVISIGLGLAGLAWMLFARSQVGRFQAKILAWLAPPFFAVAGVYGYFTFVDVDIEVRAWYARLGYLLISLPQTIVLIILSFLNRGDYGPKQ